MSVIFVFFWKKDKNSEHPFICRERHICKNQNLRLIGTFVHWRQNFRAHPEVLSNDGQNLRALKEFLSTPPFCPNRLTSTDTIYDLCRKFCLSGRIYKIFKTFTSVILKIEKKIAQVFGGDRVDMEIKFGYVFTP